MIKEILRQINKAEQKVIKNEAQVIELQNGNMPYEEGQLIAYDQCKMIVKEVAGKYGML